MRSSGASRLHCQGSRALPLGCRGGLACVHSISGWKSPFLGQLEVWRQCPVLFPNETRFRKGGMMLCTSQLSSHCGVHVLVTCLTIHALQCRSCSGNTDSFHLLFGPPILLCLAQMLVTHQSIEALDKLPLKYRIRVNGRNRIDLSTLVLVRFHTLLH